MFMPHKAVAKALYEATSQWEQQIDKLMSQPGSAGLVVMGVTVRVSRQRGDERVQIRPVVTAVITTTCKLHIQHDVVL